MPFKLPSKERHKTSLVKVRDTKVRQVMTKELVTVTERTSVKNLHELFKKHDYNVFPVVKGTDLVGIVSKLDLLRVLSTGLSFSLSRYWDTLASHVGDIMTSAVVTIRPDDTVETAADYMVEYGLRSIPVVESNRLVGIVSWNDLMEHLCINEECT